MRSENRNNYTGLPSVTIKLPEFPQRHSLQNQLCFIITAGDAISTVQVAGTFNAGIQHWFVYMTLYMIVQCITNNLIARPHMQIN